MKVYFDEPLSHHTTFHIGGPASLFIKAQDKKELKSLLAILPKTATPYYILGGGSNLLVGDKGVGGVVIKLDGAFTEFAFKKEALLAGAGVELAPLRGEACKRGLSGLEFTAGIPGTLGGAIIMNAGISPAENIGVIVKRVEIMDKSGKTRWLSPREIDFGYRRASIPPGSIILKAEIRLKKASPSAIEKKMRLLWRKRRKTQPWSEKNAGCIFKNPPGGYSAGALIEKAGLKGKSCGRASISTLHANFIINQGQAKARDVLKLMREAQEKVYNLFGVKLEPEIVVWD